MQVTLRATAAVIAAVALTAVALPAGAAMDIMPVRLNLEAGGNGAVTLSNPGSGTVSVQADSFRWGQDEAGEDRLEAAAQLVVVPPIFVLEPGASQIVRVAHMGTAAATEQAFRVVFSELPPAQTEEAAGGVAVRLRLSIPVFVRPDRPARQRLVRTGFQQDAAGAVLSLANEGTGHVKVTGLGLYFTDGSRGDVSMVRYLLPGTRRDLGFTVSGNERIHAVAVRLEGKDPVEYVVP